jgi:predicted nucleic acid-binding protein
LSRIWELRNNLTAYDAAYVALAEALEKPLLTRDRRLATAAGHRAQIELV